LQTPRQAQANETDMETLAMILFEPNENAPRILIADDDPAIVRLLADRCSLMGFEVETACNGIEAMLAVRDGGFHALIVDIHMPKVDGLSVCAHLQELFTTPPHVIVTTGSRDAGTVGRCDALSALYVAKGADFWSDLEAALVEICPARADRIKRSGLRATRVTVPARSRVLLVDDDADMEKFLRVKLDACGVDTLYAADAAQGYRVACREEPTVIVSDYAMPGGNGEHLLARLRTTRATRDIPFIVLSGHELSGTIEQSLKREIGGGPGAVRILRKSADTRELLGTLRGFCGFQKLAMTG
jgi:CheY-like chemotaxis protein